MIFMTPGQTLQCEASAATSLCVCVYARVSPTTQSKSATYTLQRVGFFALTGSGTVDTVVTCPDGFRYEVININIANSNSSNRSVRVWHVDVADAAGTDNFIAYDSVVPGNGALTINKDGTSA